MRGELLHLLPGVVAAAGLAVSAHLWLQATRALRRGTRIERFLDGFLILSWLAVATFILLAGLSLYGRWTAAAVLLAGGMLARRAAAGDAARAANDEAPGLPRLDLAGLRHPLLVLAAPAVLVALVRLIKGLVQPPMAWDAMTYHLPRAALWIQSGSLRLPDFPDAWTYYRWFPTGGDVLYSWLLLPLRGDLLLAPFGFLVWCSIVAAAARLALAVGTGPTPAWLAGFALAALPAPLVFMTASYVDNLLLLFVLLALVHAVLFVKAGRWPNALLSVAATGLALAVKISALLLALPVLVALLLTWVRRRRGRAGLLVLAAVVAVPCLGYLYTWASTGSPFYPFKMPLLGGLPFHERLDDLHSGRLLIPEHITRAGWQALVRLFWSAPHKNFGLGGLVLFALAAVGLVAALRRPGRRWPALLCLAGGMLSTPAVLSADNLALRTIWIGVMARGLLPLYAPALVWAAAAPRQMATAGLALSLLGSAVHFLPLGWSPAMTRPAAALVALLIAGAGLALLLPRLGPMRRRPRLRLASLALVGLLFLAGWMTIRARARYPIYRETAPGQGAFDAHPAHGAFAMAAPLWEDLDGETGQTLTVVVGRDTTGHNQFFYPLFGSRLQNRLVHVPISAADDGGEIEPGPRYALADPAGWMARLEAAGVDLVVGLWRPTPERDWLAAHPDEFELVVYSDRGVPWTARRRARGSPPPEAPNPR